MRAQHGSTALLGPHPVDSLFLSTSTNGSGALFMIPTTRRANGSRIFSMIFRKMYHGSPENICISGLAGPGHGGACDDANDMVPCHWLLVPGPATLIYENSRKSSLWAGYHSYDLAGRCSHALAERWRSERRLAACRCCMRHRTHRSVLRMLIFAAFAPPPQKKTCSENRSTFSKLHNYSEVQ